ncbi:MAG: NAD kinase [Alphaproteobacteria bacterium]|nr:NAD kinase [Alphaproteobacteria bacterium]
MSDRKEIIPKNHARDKLAFVASEAPEATNAAKSLKDSFAYVDPSDADVIVAIGGDGFMLQTLHDYMDRGVPIFGLNRGSVGFLMNEYTPDGLPARVAAAEEVTLHPLRMTATCVDGTKGDALAINEVSLLRQTRQTAKIEVAVDGVQRMAELTCDGVLVSTPAGSTAYNLSAYGPIIPMGAKLLALTAISAFRPRRWRGALLPHDAVVDLTVLEPEYRPVSAVADHLEVRDVAHVRVIEDRDTVLTLLFDPEHNLEERILKEQFAP